MQPNSLAPRKQPPKFLIPQWYNPQDWEYAILEKKIYTASDYERLPQGAPYQLIGGHLIMSPAPEVYHQDISRNIGFLLYEFVVKNDLGKVYFAPVDVKFTKQDVFQPDILFIQKERLNIIGKKRIEGPPDLVIEILSPSTAYYDLKQKYFQYAESGVNEYWIIDPQMKKVEIFILKNKKFKLVGEAEGSSMIHSVILAGFSVKLSDIF